MEDFIGKYDGNQIDSRLDKVKDMVGATASQAGEDGLVPAPAKGDEGEVSLWRWHVEGCGSRTRLHSV